MTQFVRAYSEHVGVDGSGLLYVEDVACEELAAQFGTPVFVISEAQIQSNMASITRAFRSRYPRTEVLFATKANNNLGVRRAFTLAGAGGECFGYGELLVTLLAGTDPKATVLNGFAKNDRDVTLAVKSGVAIHVDNRGELEQVSRIATKLGRIARVGLRPRFLMHEVDELRSDWPGAGSEPGGESIGANLRVNYKNGMPLGEVVDVCREALADPAIDLVGLHYHAGRELADVRILQAVVSEQVRIAARIRDDVGWVPEYFDVGGGMAFGRPEGHGPLARDRDVPSYDDYADAIIETFTDGLTKHDLGEPRLMIEPGRAVASNIGILVSRVVEGKYVPETGQTWIALDASQNHLMNNQSGGFYYHPVSVTEAGRPLVAHTNLVDQNCWDGNLAFDIKFPELARGDLIAFLDTGAYCESKAATFNLTPRPATVLVSGGVAEIVTRRETLTDLLARVEVPQMLSKELDLPRALAEADEELALPTPRRINA
jgi:diaminopimelate decarboxylase